MKVEIVNTIFGREVHACNATVVKFTWTQVVTVNEHGNEGRWYRANGKRVGGGDYRLSKSSLESVRNPKV